MQEIAEGEETESLPDQRNYLVRSLSANSSADRERTGSGHWPYDIPMGSIYKRSYYRGHSKMPATRFPYCPILLVDDEKQALVSLDMTLRSIGMNNIVHCQDSRDVISILSEREIEIMLIDLIMPRVSGEEILARATIEFPQIPVIIVSGTNEVDMAVSCLRQGAYDYIVKPVERNRLAASLRRAVEKRGLRPENTHLSHHFLSNPLERPEAFSGIITHNKTMQALFQYCEAVGQGHEPVLITGETGVGKELIARALHMIRKQQAAFVPVIVAGLDDNVFADTLFGHSKGAFTGADNPRAGLIEEAGAGTLFLDEIGDLSAISQVKLLRLFQQREYYPVGSDTIKTTDARIVAATHEDLDRQMASGRFRRDLFYRLETHHIHVPPLRRRKDDIPLLLDHFLKEAAREFGKKKPTYHPELLPLLGIHDYPGNVRELRAMVFDAVSNHKSGILSMKAFKTRINRNPAQREAETSKQTLHSRNSWVEKLRRLPTLKESSALLIGEAMRRANNNRRVAARMLGISHQALSKRLKRSST